MRITDFVVVLSDKEGGVLLEYRKTYMVPLIHPGIFAGAILGAISGWVVKRFYVQGQIDEVVFKDKELKK